MNIRSLRFAPLALFTLAGLAGAVAACSTSTASLRICDDPGPFLVRGAETGFEFCTNGPAHRPKVMACAAFEHAAGRCGGTEMFPQNSECAINADCAKVLPASVCLAAPGSVACSCAPSCKQDADCGPGSLCQCGDPISFCRKALCRTDADCGGRDALHGFGDRVLRRARLRLPEPARRVPEQPRLRRENPVYLRDGSSGLCEQGVRGLSARGAR